MPESDSPDLTDAAGGAPVARLTVFVRGRVQGVGFRWWTRSRALELGLVGHARNTGDGRVEVMAQGPLASLQTLVHQLEETPSTTGRPGRVEAVAVQRSGPKDGIIGFVER